jgi:hypothetical protein
VGFEIFMAATLRWARHVARIGAAEVHTGFWWGHLREGDHLEDPGVDGKTVLKFILKSGMGALTGFIWLRIGTGGGLL